MMSSVFLNGEGVRDKLFENWKKLKKMSHKIIHLYFININCENIYMYI